MRVEP